MALPLTYNQPCQTCQQQARLAVLQPTAAASVFRAAADRGSRDGAQAATHRMLLGHQLVQEHAKAEGVRGKAAAATWVRSGCHGMAKCTA